VRGRDTGSFRGFTSAFAVLVLGFAVLTTNLRAQEVVCPCSLEFDTIVIYSMNSQLPSSATLFVERVDNTVVMAGLVESSVLTFIQEGEAEPRRIGDLSGQKLGRIQGVRALDPESLVVFDAGAQEAIFISMEGEVGARLPLSGTVGPNAGIVQNGVLVTSSQYPTGTRLVITNPNGVTRSVELPAETNTTPRYSSLGEMRILEEGLGGTFWVVPFLSFALQQRELETGRLLRVLERDPPWLRTKTPPSDWRYPNLIALHQVSEELLIVLGRSLDPSYVDSPPDPGDPLKDRHSAWNLEVEVLSLKTGKRIAGTTLESWVGGFTSKGDLFFFDRTLEGEVLSFVRIGVRSEKGD